MKNRPTAEEIKRFLDYDPQTGIFTWNQRAANRVHIGDFAGWVNGKGYLEIRFGPFQERAHRLAWIVYHGEQPRYHIDHKNGDKLDNRIDNLRDVPNRENSTNTKRNREGGYPGATYSKINKCWIAQAQYKRKNHYLGSFQTAREAHEAYKAFIANPYD